MLYQLVQQHLTTYLTRSAASRSHHGAGLPAHVRRELDRYLSCGILARG